MTYFLNDIINIKSLKNIDIYYLGYITMKNFDYVNIHNVNPFVFYYWQSRWIRWKKQWK